MRTAIACAVLLALASPARADDAPPADPPPAAAPQIDARDDRGWVLYHAAFDALLRGERTRARMLAQSLSRDFAAHPATSLVQRTELLGGPAAFDRPIARGERPSRGARAELALFQTMHGLAVGTELCLVLDCEDGGAVFALALAGAATGAGISLKALDNLTSGQRALLNSGTIWGAANAALLSIAIESGDAKTVGATLLAGQGTGLVLGASLFSTKATAGQVGLANSFGQWAGAISGLTMSALSDDVSGKNLATTILVALDAGLVVGAYVASRQPDISRAQTLVLDAGGIAGTVAGGGLGVIVSGAFDSTTTRGFAAAGAVLGLGAAYYLTRTWTQDPSDTSLSAFIAPPERGQGALAGLGFGW
ncbi:MAG: hypothetical protein KF773_01645 [Deltaproteobacteria bacterium]|nr:hypothetical protein [Deltaproteobacteria bacterium]